MAVTGDAFTATDLAAVIGEVWTPIVLEELFAKTVAANFFTNLSPYLSEGGDIAHVPDLFTNTFTAKTQSTQGAEVTTESPAQSDVKLTVNTHKYISLLMGKKDLKQIFRGVYDINALYARKVGSTLKDALEDALFALWSGLSTNTVGDTTTMLKDKEVRQSIRTLDALNFDLSEIAFFVHPRVLWDQLMGIQKYYDASQAGWDVASVIRNGSFGPMDKSRGLAGALYDVPVYKSTNVVSGLQTYRNLLAHKTAFGWATQTDNIVEVQTEDARARNLGMLTTFDIIYGVKELRDEAAVVVNANTSAST